MTHPCMKPARFHAAALAVLLSACAGGQPPSSNPGHASAPQADLAAACPLPPQDRAPSVGSRCRVDADCAPPAGPGVEAAGGSAGAACEATGRCSAWFEEVDLGRGWLNFGGGWYCYGAACPDTCEVSNCREQDACPPPPCSEPPAFVRDCGGQLGQICFARHGLQLLNCTATAPSGAAVVCGADC